MLNKFKKYSITEKSIIIFLSISVLVLVVFGTKITIEKFDNTPIEYTGGF